MGDINDTLRDQGADAVRERINNAERYNPSEMMTDLGNARRLVRLYGTDLRYVHAWRKWLIWEDGHWRQNDDGCVMRMAKAAVEEMFAEASRVNDEARRTAMRNHALKSQSAPRLSAMVMLAESESKVVLPAKKLDADPYLLGVRNGVIDLRTVTFREARRDDYVTKIAGAIFDGQAWCPNWIEFLKEILDEEMIGYVQRAMGYILTGLTGEEVMFVPWGDGFNGKSTFRETIFAMLGDYAVGADASLLVTSRRSGGATPDLARLHGRRLVTINETEQNALLNESRVKFITSHDIVTARNLYEEPFDFNPTHKTWLTTNHKPIVRGIDEGIWRRIHLLPFTKTIPAKKREVNFRERVLLPELPGIINWSLDGLRAYWRDGLRPPEIVTHATKEYREDMDLIGHWIAERCSHDGDSAVTTKTLHSDYSAWTRQEIGFAVSTIAFGRDLAARGFEKTRIKYEKGFRGLRLRDPGKRELPLDF